MNLLFKNEKIINKPIKTEMALRTMKGTLVTLTALSGDASSLNKKGIFLT
jgi:hypothetical protein